MGGAEAYPGRRIGRLNDLQVISREVVLGIDFRSSTTSAGALIDDRVRAPPRAGDRVIPSVVYIPDRGAREVGRRAASRALTDPTRVVRSSESACSACRLAQAGGAVG
ncbi:MAG: hypothetical protein IPQ07_12930 [Myxococcales bacterium]|nr:hypothetical protein [Myxococcales bacterium]